MYLTQSLHRALQQNPNRIATIHADRLRTVAFAGEPIFVPRHPNAAEDDGWLLTPGR
jgi:carotenoid cleavage dioxygenase-like enzyme